MKKLQIDFIYHNSTINPDYQKKKLAIYKQQGYLLTVIDINKSEILNYLRDNKYIDLMDSIFGNINFIELNTSRKFSNIDEFLVYANR